MRVLKSMHLLELPVSAPELSSAEFPAFLRALFPPQRNSDGSWRRSRPGRHGDLDRRLAEILHSLGMQPRVFMDVGMANGISTLETIRCLANAGMAVHTIATDRNLEAFVARLRPNLDVLVEANGHLLLVEWFGRLFSPYCSRWDYLSGRFIYKLAVAAWARRKLKQRGLPLVAGNSVQGRPACVVEGPYLLVTPELKGRPDVVVRQDDILEPLPSDLVGVADVVRIVNVLRPDRFSPAQLERVAANLRRRCRDGAILVVGRNRFDKGKELRWAATFFQAEPGGRFRLLERVGVGSEVERYFTEVSVESGAGRERSS